MISAIISAILYIIAPTLYNEGVQHWGAQIRDKAEKLARQIYTKLAANSLTKDKLIEAYQNKDNRLLSDLINQAGYSAQKVSLQKEMSEAKKQYSAEKDKLEKENIDMTNDYNKLINAANTAGYSVTGNMAAEDVVRDTERLVNGGYHEETIQQQDK
jgi:type I site-specific restriction-modification system R (restriction) subunit